MESIEHLENQAIDAAIKSDWETAIRLNNAIIKLDKHNSQAILRLAFAYLQTAQYELSKKFYHKALRQQPKLAVARQNLDRIEVLEQGKSKPQSPKQAFDPDLFIETIGKTKSAVLCNLGQKQILANLYIGEEVMLKIKKRRVEIRAKNSEEYIGALPDDLSKRLILFIKAKSTYSAYVKEATLDRVVIFIREEKKGKSVHHHLSFPTNIQKNMDQLVNVNGEHATPPKSEDSEDEASDQMDDMSDWEKLVAEATEEKEELLDIQTADLEEEE